MIISNAIGRINGYESLLLYLETHPASTIDDVRKYCENGIDYLESMIKELEQS